MNLLVQFGRFIDALTERVGRATRWLILLTVLISAGNALVRYAFKMSSNAWLEVQWYLFSAVFLLCAGYALKHNQHVRVDVLSSRLSPRARVDRHPRHAVLPAADGAAGPGLVVARVRRVVEER